MVVPYYLPTHSLIEGLELKHVKPSGLPRLFLNAEKVTLLSSSHTEVLDVIVTDVDGEFYYIGWNSLQELPDKNRSWQDGRDEDRRLPNENPSHWYQSVCKQVVGGEDPRPVAPRR
eukprot:TRINITY_DN52780_c0_g1_i1.p1 TRINITY_DN52780_c0_g1~~TRINITY_DN52780_c0_g1_i1.p1  ORF type:complete len:116 (-),score=2.69 TRINITY_DN52780_c0_g1_i1:130-477(-)